MDLNRPKQTTPLASRLFFTPSANYWKTTSKYISGWVAIQPACLQFRQVSLNFNPPPPLPLEPRLAGEFAEMHQPDQSMPPPPPSPTGLIYGRKSRRDRTLRELPFSKKCTNFEVQTINVEIYLAACRKSSQPIKR